VSPAKQFYHCFGCGAHGTAVGFLMEYTGAGFVDAVKDLAQGAGMQVPETRSERAAVKTGDSDQLYEVLLEAAQYYRQQLKNAPAAIAYLKQRGLSGEIAKRFGIGYAPGGWQNLQAAFADYQAKALVAAGLVIQGNEGKRYDRFRDRIMFPIADQRGHIIGFGGRVLEQGEPKYLNSPETALFEKGRELYGLYQGRRAIRDAGRVVVVEGYMDVVALAQHDIGYAVATLGTATTPTHVQKLLRQAGDIVFCFDGDDAGRRAAWRALENSLEHLADGKQLSFLFLPQGEDPDSYVRKLGREAFEKLLNDAQPLSQFLLRELSSRVDITTNEGRARLLQEARPLIKQVAAPLLSLMLRKQLAVLGGISQDELENLYQIKTLRRTPAAPKAVRRTATSLLRKLMVRVMADPALAENVDVAMLADAPLVKDISPLELRAFQQQLGVLQSGQPIASWFEYFRDTEFAGLFEELEKDLIDLQLLDLGELRPEFVEFWQGLSRQIHHAQAAAIVEKSKIQPLTVEEGAQLLQHQQALGSTVSSDNA
jgi:DNA primase